MTIRTLAGRAVRRTPVVRSVARRGAKLLRSTPQEATNALEQRVSEVNHLTRYTHDEAIALRTRVDSIEQHMPGLLNAIASSGGMMRRLTREGTGLHEELAALRAELRELKGSQGLGGQVAALTAVALGAAQQGDLDRLGVRFDAVTGATDDLRAAIESVHSDLAIGDQRNADAVAATASRLAALEQQVIGHAQTQAWLIQRVETIRVEMLHELRYGVASGQANAAAIETHIVDQAKVDAALAAGDLRLNLGCGHIPLDGYVNVDMRELPGVDVVAPADALPFEPGSVHEIASAHFLEHFAEEDLRRRLLPGWVSLLAPGGVFRAIVPDFEEMIRVWNAGEIGFPVLRSVLFGGQEYEGDFHFTMFTPESIQLLFSGVGLEGFTVVERGRTNGECLEMEIVATKTAER